ncbi:MAG: tRNA (adenosine(37)-N6)-threonylcarbamoyltransferase complex ATPase subunit type 1 TsaE [Dehalococcoidia bacterium]|nr:tRNA (adenosine(37)-N6)-threonylcarbamoyltransferase complex ATPase subunit type 1 TsaE [Dehalococcoidia bacterium]
MQYCEFDSHSPEETATLAERLGRAVERGAILLLEGELGAGKTTFVQGLARGIGLTDYVRSPSFVLVHEYRNGPLPLFHADFFRLSGAAETLDLGLEDLAAPGVLVIEWPERAESVLPEEALRVRIIVGEAMDDRHLTFFAKGKRAEQALDALRSTAEGGH